MFRLGYVRYFLKIKTQNLKCQFPFISTIFTFALIKLFYLCLTMSINIPLRIFQLVFLYSHFCKRKSRLSEDPMKIPFHQVKHSLIPLLVKKNFVTLINKIINFYKFFIINFKYKFFFIIINIFKFFIN